MGAVLHTYAEREPRHIVACVRTLCRASVRLCQRRRTPRADVAAAARCYCCYSNSPTVDDVQHNEIGKATSYSSRRVRKHTLNRRAVVLLYVRCCWCCCCRCTVCTVGDLLIRACGRHRIAASVGGGGGGGGLQTLAFHVFSRHVSVCIYSYSDDDDHGDEIRLCRFASVGAAPAECVECQRADGVTRLHTHTHILERT